MYKRQIIYQPFCVLYLQDRKRQHQSDPLQGEISDISPGALTEARRYAIKAAENLIKMVEQQFAVGSAVKVGIYPKTIHRPRLC